MEAEQKKTCKKYGVEFVACSSELKIGVSKNIKTDLQPLNGLRHKIENGTCGWYLWRGEELSEDSDFFEPIHVSHIQECCPEAIKYLGLPPGYRFLVAPNSEDVWFDKKLL